MSVLDRSKGARTWWSSEGEGVLFAMGLAHPGDRWCRVDPVLALPCDDAVTTPHEGTKGDGAVRLLPTSAPRDHLAQPMGDSSRLGLERRASPSVPTLVVHGEGDRLVLLEHAHQPPLTDRRERTRDLPRTWFARHRDRSGL